MEFEVPGLFWPEAIIQSTVNGWLFLNRWLVVALYALGGLLFLVLFLGQRARLGGRVAAVRAMLVSLLVPAIVYGLFADYVWSRWVGVDLTLFSGKDAYQRQLTLNGNFFDYIVACKQAIGSGTYALFPDPTSNPELHDRSALLQYHLLPARKAAAAEYLVVLAEDDESAVPRTLDEAFPGDYQLCYRFSPETYLLRRKK